MYFYLVERISQVYSCEDYAFMEVIWAESGYGMGNLNFGIMLLRTPKSTVILLSPSFLPTTTTEAA